MLKVETVKVLRAKVYKNFFLSSYKIGKRRLTSVFIISLFYK